MIERLLAEQDGVVTTAQARTAGLTPEAIEWRVHTGRWRRTSRGVFFAVDRPFTDDARIRCAVWSTSTGALSGPAAAYWYRMLPRAPETIEVTVPRTGSGRGITGVRVRRRDLPSIDVVIVRRVLVTRTPLTVLEASTVLGPEVMDRALQKTMTLDHLRRAHARNPGRRGYVRAEQLLRAAEGGARSEAERLFRRIMRSAHITGLRVNLPYSGYILDFAFPHARVCVEIDGWAFHSDSAAFHRDRIRQNVLSREWTVLRYTWRDLVERPDEVAAEVRRFVTG
ncbi:type IV toxin-antitoxin system AbiEi family antitoxin domain-containing protein [Rhodococcus sp. NBC_00297]|uniref:type IV toxin-antitoxin system AbiEi family antitoxin domain-containing protein n=1 Tax=Rhodococcus sp. NBC_00297 TaxID=2976005 RepID=UPI002E2CA4CC|nr:type IV toxin-antitoxin system AbiEi family antitoxin domain-containing protein [Rhodococcus sp. NBC_00297]